MFCVSKSIDEKYGKVITITLHEGGKIKTPFFAMQRALKSRRLWRKQTTSKVRFLVDGQVMTPAQLEKWSHDEYQSLPKCSCCADLLGEDVHTHQLCGTDLFCSQSCADQDYNHEIEKIADEEEIDYL
jgi:hypothetical protein